MSSVFKYSSKHAGLIKLRSKLEGRIAKILDFLCDRKIYLSWSYEKQVVKYTNGKGQRKNYIVDFKVIGQDKRAFFIEGKGEMKDVDKRKIEAAKSLGMDIYLMQDRDVSDWEKSLFSEYRFRKAST